MAKLSPLIEQWGPMKYLIGEILLCLLAASVLGMIIGWICKAAFARDKLKARENAWQKKFREVDNEHQQALKQSKKDALVLKNRVEQLDAEKKSLNSSLHANKSAVHKAHVEVQRLNSKQKVTKGRLETIIAEKDREISRLLRETTKGKDTPPRPYGFSSSKPQTNPTQQAVPPVSAIPTGNTHAGGIPDSQQTGFKPGTQANAEDMDQTQLLTEPAQDNHLGDTGRISPAPAMNEAPATSPEQDGQIGVDAAEKLDATLVDNDQRFAQTEVDIDNGLETTTALPEDTEVTTDRLTRAAASDELEKPEPARKRSLWQRLINPDDSSKSGD